MKKIVLGIDQGLANIGYAILEKNDEEIHLIKSGYKSTSSKKSTEERLGIIYDFFDNLLNEYPDVEEIGMEEFFYGGSAYVRSVSIITTNQVSGVLLLLARNRDVKATKIQPTKVKKIITGSGKAKKDLVMENVREIFKENTFKTDHECDAVAIGYAMLAEA